jgi:hypothetical protein
MFKTYLFRLFFKLSLFVFALTGVPSVSSGRTTAITSKLARLKKANRGIVIVFNVAI